MRIDQAYIVDAIVAAFVLAMILVIVTGCSTIERAARHEHERKVREIVREEVPVIVHEEAGRIGLKVLLPWALIPAVGVGAGSLGIRKGMRGKRT